MIKSRHFLTAATCLLAGLAVFSFVNKRPVHQDGVKRVILYTSLPVVRADKELIFLQDTISFYYWHNIAMCEIPYTFLNIKNFKLLSTEPRHSLLIYQRGWAQGHLYNSVSDSISYGDQRGVDSMVKKYVYGNDVSAVKDSLNLVTTTTKGAITIETYMPYGYYENPVMFDSIYVYYNKNWANIPFTFSCSLDSIYKTKIYRFDVIFNSKYSPEYNYTFPKRRASYKFEVDEQFNDQATAEFMKTYSEWDGR